jgi:hypothetical protein
MDVRLPDGTLLRNVPDGMSKADLTAKLQSNGYDISKLGAPAGEPKSSVTVEGAPAQESNFIPRSLEEVKGQLRQDPIIQVGAGLYKGFKDVTDTGMKLAASAVDYVLPKSPGEMTRREKINALADIQDRQYQATYGESMVAPSARIVGNALATLPAGGAIAAPIKALGTVAPSVAKFTTPIAESIASGGFRTGLPAATTLGEKAIETGVRAVGGATLGGASAGMVNPEDVGTGALVGAAVPTVVAPVVKGLAKVGGKIYDLATGQMPKVQAGKLAREMAGEQINAIRAANGAAPLDITAAQATYNIDNDVWQAFNDVVQGKDKKAVFSTLKTKQAQDQFDILANLAGGANQAEARGSREATNKLLNQVTTPMREQNLLAANVGGQVGIPLQAEANAARQAAAANVDEVRRLEALKGRAINPQPGNLMNDYPLSNMPEKADQLANQAAAESLAQGEAARIAESKIADLKANGLNPLNINGVTGKLRGLATAPGTRADPVQVRVLSSIEQQIKDLAARNGGVIDANDLYQIRKTGINDTIEAELRSGGLDPITQSKVTAELLGKVRSMVDDAIEAAGGKGWRDYLSTHAAGMRQIEQKELAAKAMDLYQTSPKQFIDLIKGNDIKAIEEIFGPGNYDVAKAMGDQMVKLQKVAGEVERDVIKIPERIAAGRRALEITEPSVSGKIPGFVGYKTALAKKFVQIAEGKVNQKTMDALIKGAENGKNMNDLLNTLPAEERVKVLKVLSNSKEWNSWVTRAAGAAATEPVNNLAPGEQNVNALAR